MNYLLDKKTKKRKFSYILFSVAALFILFYFRFTIFNSLSFLSQTIFRPVLVLGNSIGQKLGSVSSYFLSKNALYIQNQNLKAKLLEDEARMSNYDSIL